MDTIMEQMKDPAYVHPELAEVGCEYIASIPSTDTRGSY
jgi:hypothetical protein